MALGETFLWALRELLSARLGDARLNVRLAKLVAAFIVAPNGSLPETFQTWGDLKAAYRFFSNRRVQARSVFEAHAQSTMGRLQGRPIVLVAQDTTFFNYTTHPHMTGLGPIGANRQKQRGFGMHSALAIDAKSGEPLGLLGAILWARKDPAATMAPAKPDRPAKTPEEKESARWIKMLKHVTRDIPAGTQVVAVSDRESDTIEYLHAAVCGNHPFVARATHNRRLANGQEKRLWEAAEAAKVLGVVMITVPRADNRPTRQAQLALQAVMVELAPPSGKRSLGPVRVTALLAREVMCPGGQQPLNGLLLTNVPVVTAADAAQRLQWYAHRWKIERFHFVRKSGCRVEELQLAEAVRIQRALAVFSVVAWRLLALTYGAREHPDQPCTRLLSDDEWRALACFINATATPPAEPPDLHTAVRWIAKLGGFIGRRSDGEPGVKVIWRGLRRLPDITAMWRIMQRRNGCRAEPLPPLQARSAQRHPSLPTPNGPSPVQTA